MNEKRDFVSGSPRDKIQNTVFKNQDGVERTELEKLALTDYYQTAEKLAKAVLGARSHPEPKTEAEQNVINGQIELFKKERQVGDSQAVNAILDSIVELYPEVTKQDFFQK